MQQLEYVIGDQTNNRFIDEYKLFQKEYFIFSVFPFYNHEKKVIELSKKGIHNLVNHQGKILLDSGGFQLINKNLKINPDDTLELYKKAKLRKFDNGICLDYCPRCDESIETRINKINLTNQNFKYMYEKNKKVIHVIHGWTKKEIELSFQGVIDENLISYGSCFTMLAMNSAFDELLDGNSVKDLLIKRFIVFKDILKQKKFDELRIHILGASSGNSSHLMWYAGMDQCDSSNWRIKAAYGKISFLGITEVKISKRESLFGAKGWKSDYDKLLKECECPICKGLSLIQKKDILSESFKARCVHNAFIYLQERDLAREMIGTSKYKIYLENRFKKSYFWRKFLKVVDESKHQKDIDSYFKF